MFISLSRERGLKYPLLVKRLACMVISGAISSDHLDILQPSSLSPHMVSEVRYFTILIMSFWISYDDGLSSISSREYKIFPSLHLGLF